MYILWAEREGCAPRQMTTEPAPLWELAAFVELSDEGEDWPEGFDAVARAPGEAWVFTDQWEKLP